MFRDQVYNTVSRQTGPGALNSDTFRRLNRRIHHNMGLLNTSRSSNHSSSFRMRRTELSGERYNNSRDPEQNSQHISGLPSHDVNDSRGKASNKMGSILNLSRRRLQQEGQRPLPLQRNGGKNIVENLYMLTNNQIPGRDRSNRQHYQEVQSPRAYQTRYQQEDMRKVEGNSRESRNENRVSRNSRDSKLGQRQRSKQQSHLRVNKQQTSRDKRYPVQTQHRNTGQIKRLEEKYLQNIYQLNSPRGKQGEKRRSEKQIQGSLQSNTKHSNASTKNMNYYYFNQAQVSSTSGGTCCVRTLPETSKVDTISQASLPVHSVASQKDMIAKQSTSPRLHQKNSVKLDRPKQKVSRNEKDRKKQLENEASSLSVRWKVNNVKLEERKDEPKRKQKVIDQDQDILPLGSVFLPVQSKRQEGRQWAQDILERIILHLQCLNIIADYTKQFKKMYENTQPWQILIFLTYKKFYIQRTKIGNVLKSPSLKKDNEQSKLLMGFENPFILPYSKISDEEISRFRGSRQCVALRYELQIEDTRIRNALRGLYNLYIQKSGQHVNMLDCDNFSEQIYKLMMEELEGISENLQEESLVEPTKLRMGKIIKAGLLIAYLNGKYVKNFAQLLLHEDTIKVGKRQKLRQGCTADIYLSEFKKIFS